ncbi:MAG: Eco57I restriction-modification methylase domain-containing protein [Thermodesulfobacteriota bacterium]
MGDGTESGASGQRAPSFTERNRPTPDTRRLTPNRVAKLKVLDPACGSGSFLLGAYQYLLDWHLAWYRENNPEKHAKGKRPVVYRGSGGEWRLTTQEKKRILLTNIYGVDIDRQAVEVTKLSLLLKVLEDENQETLGTTLSLFKERALPDLRNNIKCGNSLIGPDFYDQMELGLGDDEIRRINVFDWNDDERGFGEIMKNGGFDAVIGNPPYVRQEIFGEFKPYLQSHYKTWHGSGDLYVYFIEKAVSLLKEDGHFSYIVANKWMRANYGESLRRWMKEQAIEEIIDFGDLPVFQKATTYPCILRISRGKARIRPTFLATKVKTLDFRDLQEYVDEHSHEVSRAALDDSGWSLATEKEEALLSKIRTTGVPLDEYVEGMIFYGIKTGLNAAFVIDRETRDRLIAEEPKSQELIKPFLMGRDIKRYAITNEGRYLILIPKGWTREQSGGASNAWRWFSENYPAIANHLLPFREKAEKRYDKGEYWWELRACEYYKEFEKPKIIIPSIVKSASYTYDDKCFYSNDKTSIIAIGDKYLLGLLNSKVLDYFIHSIASTKQGGYLNTNQCMFPSSLSAPSTSTTLPKKHSMIRWSPSLTGCSTSTRNSRRQKSPTKENSSNGR